MFDNCILDFKLDFSYQLFSVIFCMMTFSLPYGDNCETQHAIINNDSQIKCN
jgi:hypothetical protein